MNLSNFESDACNASWDSIESTSGSTPYIKYACNKHITLIVVNSLIHKNNYSWCQIVSDVFASLQPNIQYVASPCHTQCNAWVSRSEKCWVGSQADLFIPSVSQERFLSYYLSCLNLHMFNTFNLLNTVITPAADGVKCKNSDVSHFYQQKILWLPSGVLYCCKLLCLRAACFISKLKLFQFCCKIIIMTKRLKNGFDYKPAVICGV